MTPTDGGRKMLASEQRDNLLGTLKVRFENNMGRHRGLEWTQIQVGLNANPEKLWSLQEMERTGGEPDVVGHDQKTGKYVFYDLSAETPKAAAASLTTVRASRREKNTGPKTPRSIWQQLWASSC